MGRRLFGVAGHCWTLLMDSKMDALHTNFEIRIVCVTCSRCCRTRERVTDDDVTNDPPPPSCLPPIHVPCSMNPLTACLYNSTVDIPVTTAARNSDAHTLQTQETSPGQQYLQYPQTQALHTFNTCQDAATVAAPTAAAPPGQHGGSMDGLPGWGDLGLQTGEIMIWCWQQPQYRSRVWRSTPF